MTAELRPHPLIRWLVLGCCIVVWIAAFVATHTPPARLPEMPTSSLVLHVVGYFGLGLMLLATLTAFEVGRWRRVLTALVVLMVYAAADEATQPFFGRHACVYDWLANVLGSTIAIAVWEPAWRVTRRLRRPSVRNQEHQARKADEDGA